jgi:hypothetical protein
VVTPFVVLEVWLPFGSMETRLGFHRRACYPPLGRVARFSRIRRHFGQPDRFYPVVQLQGVRGKGLAGLRGRPLSAAA